MQEILVRNNKSCQAQGTFIAVKKKKKKDEQEEEGHEIMLFREVCKTFEEIHHFSCDIQIPF